jgi:hypothetical protein
MERELREGMHFVREMLLSGATPGALFDTAVARGLDLADVLDASMYEGPGEDGEWFEVELDGLLALAEHLGLERAADIAARSRTCAHVDVPHYVATSRARSEVRAAIGQRTALSVLFGSEAFAYLDESERALLARETAWRYPIAELVDPTLPEPWRAMLRGELGRRFTAFEAFEALAGVVDDRARVQALIDIWDVAAHPDADDAVLACFAAVSRAESRPMGVVARFAMARDASGAWLGVMRAHDFKGAQAALLFLEAGWTPPSIAHALAAAGYDDASIVAALLENGLGTHASLVLLQAAGWSAARLVATLHARDVMLPEVRGRLDELGVPRATQITLVERHWSPSAVALVFRD